MADTSQTNSSLTINDGQVSARCSVNRVTLIPGDYFADKKRFKLGGENVENDFGTEKNPNILSYELGYDEKKTLVIYVTTAPGKRDEVTFDRKVNFCNKIICFR